MIAQDMARGALTVPLAFENELEIAILRRCIDKRPDKQISFSHSSSTVPDYFSGHLEPNPVGKEGKITLTEAIDWLNAAKETLIQAQAAYDAAVGAIDDILQQSLAK